MPDQKIYLDHAATTYFDPRVLEAMLPYFTENFGNPGSRHHYGYQAKKALDKARNTVAEILNCKPKEIIFTSGGTLANNLAIFGIAYAHKKDGNHLITSKIEHSSVYKCFQQLEKEGFEVTYLNVDREGFVDLDELKKTIKTETILVSIIYANNEIGVIQGIHKIAEICGKKTKSTPNKPFLHIDACQAAGSLEMNVQKLAVDLMTINGSKIYGPKAIGALFIKEGIKLKPLIYGGGQESDLVSGTENIPYIIGFAKALELSQKEKNQENERLKKLQNILIEELLKIPGTKLNGPNPPKSPEPFIRLPNNINITFPYTDGDQFLLLLDESGICASTGSACDAHLNEPSHVLQAIGLNKKQAQSSLRFSLGKTTDEAQILKTVEVINQTIKKLKK